MTKKQDITLFIILIILDLAVMIMSFLSITGIIQHFGQIHSVIFGAWFCYVPIYYGILNKIKVIDDNQNDK